MGVRIPGGEGVVWGKMNEEQPRRHFRKIRVAFKLCEALEHIVKGICRIMGISKPTMYRFMQ
jgi:hypothetical protein